MDDPAPRSGATGSPAEEAELVPLAAGGDRSAAERLAALTYRGVYASLVKLAGDPDLAADLTQETYRKAWAALARFDGRSRFSTWLYRIAYNTFLNHLRRPRLVRSLDEERAANLPDPEPHAPERLLRRHRIERTRAAVLALPEKLRFAVAARYWAELPVREIARLQGISQVGVRKRLMRAREQLAARLEEELS